MIARSSAASRGLGHDDAHRRESSDGFSTGRDGQEIRRWSVAWAVPLHEGGGFHCRRGQSGVVHRDQGSGTSPRHSGEQRKFTDEFLSGTLDEDLKYKCRDTFLYQWATGNVGKPTYYWVIVAIENLTTAVLAARTNHSDASSPWTDRRREMDAADHHGLHDIQPRHVEPVPWPLSVVAYSIAGAGSPAPCPGFRSGRAAARTGAP